ncbi:hypothetical protein Plhal304r1_c026g0087921 [Plasmopara halstedii]
MWDRTRLRWEFNSAVIDGASILRLISAKTRLKQHDQSKVLANPEWTANLIIKSNLVRSKRSHRSDYLFDIRRHEILKLE